VTFSEEWWAAFRLAWNTADEDHSTFGRVSAMRIEVTDAPHESAEIRWDATGSIRAISVGGPERLRIPTFKAPQQIWADFISGKTPVTRLVLHRKIHYEGPTGFLLSHAVRFELLARIGRLVSAGDAGKSAE